MTARSSKAAAAASASAFNGGNGTTMAGSTAETILCSMTRYRKTSECYKFYLFKSVIESNESNHFLVNHGKSTHSLVT